MALAMNAGDPRFEAWLTRETGMDAALLGLGALARAVMHRARAMHHAAPSGSGAAADGRMIDSYWKLFNTSRDERQAVIEALVVPETWFFRDREAFVAIARLADAQLVREPARTLRILSAPCSTGEEPYSISMALLDAGIDPARFRIDAVDISNQAIARARKAVYGRNSFRSTVLEFRDRHFSARPDGWALNDRVREPVRFIQANLFDLPVEAGEHYDFIFCRNVLIYFSRDAQDRAVRLLDARLAGSGLLFVGPAETGLMRRHALAPARIPLAFAFRRAPAAGAGARPAGGPGAAPFGRVNHSPPPRPAPWAARPSAHDGAAGRGVPAEAGATRDRPPAMLDDARRLADTGRLSEAERIAHRYTLEHGPAAEAFCLLGLIADARGRVDDAKDFYRKTLYLDPDHYESLTHLAVLIGSAGDEAGAAHMMNRARRVLARRDAAEPGRDPHGGTHDPSRS